MKIIDVTRPVRKGMPVYPGDIIPSFSQTDQGLYRISDIHLSSHTGTHVDAPAHYFKSGETVDKIPLSSLIGTCRVIDVSGCGSMMITAADLKSRIHGAERILLKTRFSGMDASTREYPSLSFDASCSITDSGIVCVGIDSLSVESYNGDGAVHRRLLSHGCIIIELLDLSEVPEGEYEMVALPLRLEGLDGSPARVILFKKEETSWI